MYLKMVKHHDFSVGSLNVRGLCNILKRRGVMDWAEKQDFDIMMLQESFSTCKIEDQWSKDWGGTCVFSHGTNHSKGVMILVKKGFDLDLKTKIIDDSGRYISNNQREAICTCESICSKFIER